MIEIKANKEEMKRLLEICKDNRKKRIIFTVEKESDDFGYVYGVIQTTYRDGDLESFNNAVKQAKRHDPDVLIIERFA